MLPILPISLFPVRHPIWPRSNAATRLEPEAPPLSRVWDGEESEEVATDAKEDVQRVEHYGYACGAVFVLGQGCSRLLAVQGS